MSAQQHTAGPWEVVDHWPHNGSGWQIWGAGVHVASVTGGLDKPAAQKIADAHLIAASPRLLAATKALLAEVWDVGRNDEIIAAVALAEAAIAEAEAVS